MSHAPRPFQHIGTGFADRVAKAACGFGLLGVCLCLAGAAPLMAAENTAGIAFSCGAAAGVPPAEREAICAEALAAFQAAYPDRGIAAGVEGPARIELTISHATARGMGLAVQWTDAEGRTSEGATLSTSFFDRASDPVTRGRFYAVFLTQNPLPF